MLRVEDVRAIQGDFTLRASFEVERGRRIAIIGPSGAGKSTLLGVLGGYLPVAQGRIEIDGQDVTHADPDARGIAMLFQDGNLFPHLTVAQNVGLALRSTLRLKPSEVDAVRRAVQRVGLGSQLEAKPGALSGGQLSRAALARVLLQGKPLLLLDEPFAALGPALRAEMLDLTADVARETEATLLMVTHAPQEAARIADDLIFVDAGVVHAPQAADHLLADPPPALRAYLGDAG